MNTALLVIVFIAVFVNGVQILSVAEKYKLPRMLSALLWGCFITFMGSLIPGALGYYSPLPVSATTVLLSALSVFSIWKATKTLPLLPRLQFDLASLQTGPWTFASKTIAMVSLLLLYPYAECFAKLAVLLFSPAAELGWDAVSYHLPGLIEFVQAHTLWSFEGPYQSYSFGFELIYGLSILFCHSHWGVVVGHGLSIVLMILSTTYLTGQLLDTLRECGIEKINRLMVQLAVQAIWAGLIFRTSLDGVGNNDVFEAAMLVSAFGYLFDFSRRDRSHVGARTCLVLLGGMAFVLALATKPPALAFAPLFALMALTKPAQNRLGLSLNMVESWRALPWVAGIMAVGTFFLWHNISKFGGICDPALASGFRDTLLHHLRDPKLYQPNFGEFMFFSSGISLLFVWALWKRCATHAGASAASSLLWIAGLFITGAAAFAYTPFGVIPDYDANKLTRLFFQDRKAMVMYLAAAISLALSVGVWCAKSVKTPASSGDKSGTEQSLLAIPAPLTGAILACFVAFIPAINWWWHRDWPIGLAGYETVKGLPRTNIYQWVQNLNTANRIYASGLRPYGLLGRDYENRLFYDLHSHILDAEHESRLLSVLDQFHPDLVLISVDPHPYTGDPHKPELVEWMKQQPCFVQVYEDETVTGFRVDSKWREVLQKYKLPETPVRMHS